MTRATMADKGKAPLNDDGDERSVSVNHKRKHTSVLDVLNDDFQVAEIGSSNVELVNDGQTNNASACMLYVTTPAGQVKYLKVKNSDTIGSIKLKIQTHECIPFDEQELFFKGVVLEDMNILANLRVQDSCALTLVRKLFMDILIKNLEGRIMYYLIVKPTDTIASVKAQIKMKKGTSVEDQVLIFNKMVLGNDGTLFDFHIKDKSTLTLIHKSRGIMKIFIKTLTGAIITEEVKPWNTIGNIKANIQNKVHVSYDEQELIFNETVLHNLCTLADYNIKTESTITLRRLSMGFMQIFIKTLTGTTFTLDVKPLNTISIVKRKIQDNMHIHKVEFPYYEQELIFNDMVLNNIDTLIDYDIKRESTLTLVGISTGVMQIFIKIHPGMNPGIHPGKTITIEVKPSHTIADLKDNISQKETDCSPSCQVLTFNKKILKDGTTVAFNNIHKESTVDLYIRR